jgi:hypothetical protein
MSGKPNPEEVKELVKALNQVTWARERIAAVTAEINGYAAQLRAYEIKLSTAQQKVQDCLNSMDVSRPGNIGWEQRQLALLSLMAQRM